MKSYIKSIIFLSCILAGGNYVCGTEFNQNVEPAIKEGRTIIVTFDIANANVNKGVQIINDRNTDKNTRTGIENIYIYKLCNNKEEQLEQMEPGNGVDGIVNKHYKFKKQGEYKICYYFKEGIEDMSYMFSGCSSLTSLDFSNFNTNSVTDMSGMFDGCFFLTSLNLSDFRTDSVVNMAAMFRGCSSLTSLNLSDFKTDSVVNMAAMFERCSSLKSLNLSNFNIDKVVNMKGMFCGCSSLKTLDLSNFNTEKVNKKDDLFYGCFNLKRVTTNDEYIESLFKDSKAVRVLNPNSCRCPCCKNR